MIHILLLTGGFVTIVPFLWMIFTSFKTNAELFQFPPSLLPAQWNLNNFQTIFETLDFSVYYANTIQVTLFRTAAQLLFCSMAGFSFAKLRFPGRKLIFGILLVALMVPTQMNLIPSYLIMNALGLVDTVIAVALPGMFSVFGMFLMRQFFASIPSDFLEAARIEGAGFFTIFARIYFPLIKTGIATLVLFTVVYSWNDFLWPLIISFSERSRVLSVGVALLQGYQQTYFNQLMAGAVVAVVPVLVMVILLQRFFVTAVFATQGIK